MTSIFRQDPQPIKELSISVDHLYVLFSCLYEHYQEAPTEYERELAVGLYELWMSYRSQKDTSRYMLKIKR